MYIRSSLNSQEKQKEYIIQPNDLRENISLIKPNVALAKKPLAIKDDAIDLVLT